MGRLLAKEVGEGETLQTFLFLELIENLSLLIPSVRTDSVLRTRGGYARFCCLQNKEVKEQ